MSVWGDIRKRGNGEEVRKEDSSMVMKTLSVHEIYSYNCHRINPEVAKTLKSCDIEVKCEGEYVQLYGYYERFHIVCKIDEDEQEVLKSIMLDVEKDPVHRWIPDENYDFHQVELNTKKGVKHKVIEHNGKVTGVDPWL